MEQLKQIEEYIEKFIKDHADENFKFRKYQKEVIIDIVQIFLGGEKKSYTLEAPTGAGKSCIAIVASYVLNQFGKTGYILASDIALQTQYEEDIAKYKLWWGSIKGVDNYRCTENGEKYSLGECTMRNIPTFKKQFLPCYKDCPYLSAREKAKDSQTSLLNYSYWLIQRNYVAKHQDEEPFRKRDFIICDEAHKLVDIVQNHFSPTIDIMTNTQLEKLRQFILSKEFGSINVKHTDLTKIIDKLLKENKKDLLINHLNTFEQYLSLFNEKVVNIKEFIAKKYAFKSVPSDWTHGLYLCDMVKDLHCKVQDYNIIINEAGLTSLINDQSNERTSYKCLDESYLMKKYFHEECGYEIIMSATIGDPKVFAKLNKIESGRFIRIKSTFNFNESPIYAYIGKKMSFNDKEETMPWLINKIEEIGNHFPDESGIIHSSSYAVSKDIFNQSSAAMKKRLLCYTSSEDKKEMIAEFLKSKNKILCGPSITEGLDLHNDRSRFQIIAKMSYPSMLDNFVSAKMKIDNNWYQWKTILHLLQGIGRSIRHENDYCTTFILDGCFVNTFKRNQDMFNQEFKDRLVWLKHECKNWFDYKPIKIEI